VFLRWVDEQNDVCFVSGVRGVWCGAHASAKDSQGYPIGSDHEMESSSRRLLELSVDRVDSALPYVLGNMQVILWRLNCAKNSLHQSDLLQLVRALRVPALVLVSEVEDAELQSKT
jgi:hypothetical protein